MRQKYAGSVLRGHGGLLWWQREAPGMATLLAVGHHVLHVQASFDISLWGSDKLDNKRQNLNNVVCL